ncbi:glycosyltransferase family 2 protein [Paenibacillus mesophilus]|uniref:glycosyltransferase n=1 Tax=Paenibacillus mesophilus TaxID=2582849 RepID=UPI00110EB642|nr:glycosyltransferase family A protein [Paenibacillus mesophilus]TMV46250.1 glycosyltransferase family 2 protein [Paenibacillus mesophilus]
MSLYVNRIQGVSVITCTNRPLFFSALINNYRRQRYNQKELIVVLNKDSMDLAKFRRMVSSFPNISVHKVPEKFSLGRCLNYGIGKAKYPIIAKFDDDDYYAPNYLMEQVRALRRTGADIVGKGAHLKFFEGKRLLAITTPSEKNKFVNYVAGGTLLFERRLHNRVRFADRTLGEDTNFLQRSRAKGYRLYATSPYNFVGIRRANKKSHTWTLSDDIVMRGSKFVARTIRYRRWASRPVK